KAVYVSEFADNQLLRFDKNIPNPTTRCATLVTGTNPCMSEILLPMLDPHVDAHSIALVGGRLWFTMANDLSGTDPNSALFGYVDTSTWAAGTPRGVYFTNLANLGIHRANQHHSFRGIDVTAAGRVALADGGEDQIINLTTR